MKTDACHPGFPQSLLSPRKILLVFSVAAMLAGGHVSAQSPAAYYDTAKQRLLAISAAQFITNTTQGAIEPDSAPAFRLPHLWPRLTPALQRRFSGNTNSTSPEQTA